MLTMPDEAMECVAFLATEDDGRLKYGGTAFVVSLPAEGERYFPYLVTAKHNVELAKRQQGRLVARFNTAEGSSIVDLSHSEVVFPEDPGVDLAVIADLDWAELIRGGRMRHLSLGAMAASDAFLRDNAIGVGSTVYVTGLFALRHGNAQNLPVGRTGTIAAMPFQFDEDEWTGAPYRAYIVEVWSMAGLSGSPVFVLTPPKFVKPDEGDAYLDQNLRLLGLMRGHWTYRPEAAVLDIEERLGEMAHSGLGIVTPVDQLIALLDREDFRRDRDQRIRQG
jgi:hypothetical protein